MPSHFKQTSYDNSDYYDYSINGQYCNKDGYSKNIWNVDGNVCMNKSPYTTNGGWRDSMLRKDLNDESSGIIWNAIISNDFKYNVAPVLKITNNNRVKMDYRNEHGLRLAKLIDHNGGNTSNSASITTDKLFILSPSEMGMPIMKNYNAIGSIINYNDLIRWGRSHYPKYSNSKEDNSEDNSNVHYYNGTDYYNTLKSSADGANRHWFAEPNYIYAGNTYQWWMLPAGYRKMSNDSQAYHNTDSYSYCSTENYRDKIIFPSSNKSCNNINSDYYLRSQQDFSVIAFYFSAFADGVLYSASWNPISFGAILAFAF